MGYKLDDEVGLNEIKFVFSSATQRSLSSAPALLVLLHVVSSPFCSFVRSRCLCFGPRKMVTLFGKARIYTMLVICGEKFSSEEIFVIFQRYRFFVPFLRLTDGYEIRFGRKSLLQNRRPLFGELEENIILFAKRLLES